MNFQFSAFADESSNVFTEQISALKRNDYRFLEIRGVDGKNVTELTVCEAKQLTQMLKDNGLSVWSVGSPIGKIPVDGDWEAHLELYRHTLELAAALETNHIRLFSFYMPANSDPAQYASLVIDRMGVFGELAAQAGVVACHENEKGIFGDNAARCLQIYQACPQVRGVFDPANFIQCGQDTLQAWDMLAPYMVYMHIKDALPNGKVVPPGQGAGNVAQIVQAYGRQGGKVLSLEPHLYAFVGLKNLEQEGGESIVGALNFTTAKDAFDYAAQNLIRITQAQE